MNILSMSYRKQSKNENEFLKFLFLFYFWTWTVVNEVILKFLCMKNVEKIIDAWITFQLTLDTIGKLKSNQNSISNS